MSAEHMRWLHEQTYGSRKSRRHRLFRSREWTASAAVDQRKGDSPPQSRPSLLLLLPHFGPAAYCLIRPVSYHQREPWQTRFTGKSACRRDWRNVSVWGGFIGTLASLDGTVRQRLDPSKFALSELYSTICLKKGRVREQHYAVQSAPA